MFASEITAAELREILHYNPLTGVFTHIRPVAKGWPIQPGTTAGTKTKSGYIRIGIAGAQHLAHRLAWLYVNGVHAPGFLDHKDCVRTNNWILNLRVATKRENAQNRRKASSANTHGWLGVTFRPRQGWVSQICIDYQQYVLGYFKTPEEAHLMYLLAKQEFHQGSLINA